MRGLEITKYWAGNREQEGNREIYKEKWSSER